MSVLVNESELPQELTADGAAEAAYPGELAEVVSKLQRGLPALVESDKDLTPFLIQNIRDRLKPTGPGFVYLDGRPKQDDQSGGTTPQGMIGTMIAQLRDAVRGAVERRVVVLPHLDLLTTSQGGLTAEAREVIPLLYENPDVVWLGFKDPSFPLPRVIENLFPHRVSLLGIRLDRLRHLITRRESRKLGREFNPRALYKYVSGINAVRLRKLLSTLEGEDYPSNPQHAFRQLRQATVGATMEIPNISLSDDIGGYSRVKDRLDAEILAVLARIDQLDSEEQIKAIEELIPKGMIFWGPPGTGKTLFAKAMASEIGAAITIVSGPELKSKWVGESEDNLRQIFHKARQAAPSIIVFDELDSFASARGTYTGSGVEHSMVNQLLTEMDGFHREEMVFVVGTTNFVEALDPALLRPGRFEFHLHIPYPDADARREILRIYDRKMTLQMTAETLEHAVRRTNFIVPGAAAGTLFSGDHLNALCRAIARRRLRADRTDPTTPDDVEQALTEWVDKQKLSPAQERVVATHEAGHAVLALAFDRPIVRIALADDVIGALGYVRHSENPDDRKLQTRAQMLEEICICLGGRESELMLLGDLYDGATQDLHQATLIARYMVEVLGMGGEEVGPVRYRALDNQPHRQPDLSPAQQELLDRRVRAIIEEQRERAAAMLSERRATVEALRDVLVEKKVIEAKTLRSLVGDDGSAGDPKVRVRSDRLRMKAEDR
jgi:cell division protease FtsH